VNNMFTGCILYADDIMILSASICGLQSMLNSCYASSRNLDLRFNCKKSFCITMGPRWQSQLPDMTLGNDAINWSSSIKYLGVTITAGPVFKTDINILTRKFFASCNAVLGNCVCF
jgi:hypothetical protein